MTKFMKKSVKGIVSTVLCATMIGGSVVVTGCKSKATAKRTYNNETDPLVLASDPVDRVFNPFFSTTGADGSGYFSAVISRVMPLMKKPPASVSTSQTGTKRMPVPARSDGRYPCVSPVTALPTQPSASRRASSCASASAAEMASCSDTRVMELPPV